MGGLIGLDYGSVYLVASSFGMEINPAMLRKIQLLEIQELMKSNKPQGKEVM